MLWACRSAIFSKKQKRHQYWALRDSGCPYGVQVVKLEVQCYFQSVPTKTGIISRVPPCNIMSGTLWLVAGSEKYAYNILYRGASNQKSIYRGALTQEKLRTPVLETLDSTVSSQFELAKKTGLLRIITSLNMGFVNSLHLKACNTQHCRAVHSTNVHEHLLNDLNVYLVPLG